jgi:hypothetical protein
MRQSVFSHSSHETSDLYHQILITGPIGVWSTLRVSILPTVGCPVAPWTYPASAKIACSGMPLRDGGGIAKWIRPCTGVRISELGVTLPVADRWQPVGRLNGGLSIVVRRLSADVQSDRFPRPVLIVAFAPFPSTDLANDKGRYHSQERPGRGMVARDIRLLKGGLYPERSSRGSGQIAFRMASSSTSSSLKNDFQSCAMHD